MLWPLWKTALSLHNQSWPRSKKDGDYCNMKAYVILFFERKGMYHTETFYQTGDIYQNYMDALNHVIDFAHNGRYQIHGNGTMVDGVTELFLEKDWSRYKDKGTGLEVYIVERELH